MSIATRLTAGPPIASSRVTDRSSLAVISSLKVTPRASAAFFDSRMERRPKAALMLDDGALFSLHWVTSLAVTLRITHAGASDARPFELVCLYDVDAIPIDWLWQDRLARGHLTLFASDPGLGKSQITIDLSRGGHWPIGPSVRAASSMFLCSEDSVADTIRPRAEAAGANLKKVHVLKSAVVKNGKKKSFNLGDDLDILGDAIRQVGDVGFVCIDAITSYMGKIDSHRNTDVRSVLEPVAGFAELHRVSMLGVTHIPKSSHGSALKAFLGSVGFIATAAAPCSRLQSRTRIGAYSSP